MESFYEGYFYNPSLGQVDFDRVVREIISYIFQKPENVYEIIIGCDSSSNKEPFFPVAVVVLRKGAGGRFFLKRMRYAKRDQKKFGNWKMRVLQEVLFSCELALCLKERFQKELEGSPLSSRYQLRYIHADVGENGATKDMIREITGLIRGNGFEPKIKPQAFVASSVADRYT